MESIPCFEMKVIETVKYDRELAQPRQTSFDTNHDMHISVKEETFLPVDDKECIALYGHSELEREIHIKSNVQTSSNTLFATFQNLRKWRQY